MGSLLFFICVTRGRLEKSRTFAHITAIFGFMLAGLVVQDATISPS